MNGRACAALLSLLAAAAQAAVLIVDGQNPAARDDNPGTAAAPFKTIQAALDKAQAGDTVGVHGGVYSGKVTIARSGSGPNFTAGPSYSAYYWGDPVKWVTLEAFGDERVVIDGTAEITADLWKLVAGKTNTYAAAFKGQLKPERYMDMVHPAYLYADGVPVKHAAGKNPSTAAWQPPNVPALPEDAAEKPGWFYDIAKGLFYVNLGGKKPGRDARITVSDAESGIDVAGCSCVRVRKLEIRGFTYTGISANDARNCVIEDNYIHDCGNGMALNIVECVIRRNVIADVTRNGIGMACRGGAIEGNVIRRFNRNPYG
ncbi:MAG: right-handed parallel beta-helix repeat-containing protein, partial [Armatimonadota bacterium]